MQVTGCFIILPWATISVRWLKLGNKIISTKQSAKILVPYFPAYKTHRPIRRTVIFSLGILERNNDECILILVIYWKKIGLLHNQN